MRIAVTTPTGNVGRHVVTMLLRAGIRPRVLARDPGRLDPGVRREVDAVAVDQRDAEAVVAATAGVDALFWVDPPSAGPDPLADYAAATKSVASAVAANGIARTVFLSSVGAEKRRGAGEIDGLAATELALDALGATVTHLRCGYFFTNLESQLDAVRAGVIPVVLPLDLPLAWVAPRDVAEVAVARLLSGGWSGRGVQAVHGPADLTWPQAAAVVSAATGRPLRAERVGDDEMRGLLRASGRPDGVVEAVMGMSTGLRDGFVPEQPRTLRSTTPTTLGSWAYEVLRPRL
ncbi:MULTISPECIES: NAD(P)H-binding protein [unclassified Streptomyces]|uniref:NAD(P)H-binding protein n=1 Tax=unclassified Streptomyces TaxID=2593676 RepID=UPI00116F68AD|nr:NAD(P)H-binding protein [Streptomyces sp. 1-11]GEJ98716.1 NmrA family transcriptional regulator [Streptomyces sp. 1-11]